MPTLNMVSGDRKRNYKVPHMYYMYFRESFSNMSIVFRNIEWFRNWSPKTAEKWPFLTKNGLHAKSISSLDFATVGINVVSMKRGENSLQNCGNRFLI